MKKLPVHTDREFSLLTKFPQDLVKILFIIIEQEHGHGLSLQAVLLRNFPPVHQKQRISGPETGPVIDNIPSTSATASRSSSPSFHTGEPGPMTQRPSTSFTRSISWIMTASCHRRWADAGSLGCAMTSMATPFARSRL